MARGLARDARLDDSILFRAETRRDGRGRIEGCQPAIAHFARDPSSLLLVRLHRNQRFMKTVNNHTRTEQKGSLMSDHLYNTRREWMGRLGGIASAFGLLSGRGRGQARQPSADPACGSTPFHVICHGMMAFEL